MFRRNFLQKVVGLVSAAWAAPFALGSTKKVKHKFDDSYMYSDSLGHKFTVAHKVLTKNGWKEISEIQKGEVIESVHILRFLKFKK